jgi:hypothetical protein
VINTGDWVYIKLPDPIILTSVDIFARPNLYARAPGRFKIYGSNNGASWTALHDQTSQTLAYSSDFATVAVNYTNRAIPLHYRYIGLVVSQLATTGINSYMLQIAEMKLYGKTTSAACKKVTSYALLKKEPCVSLEPVVCVALRLCVYDDGLFSTANCPCVLCLK